MASHGGRWDDRRYSALTDESEKCRPDRRSPPLRPHRTHFGKDDNGCEKEPLPTGERTPITSRHPNGARATSGVASPVSGRRRTTSSGERLRDHFDSHSRTSSRYHRRLIDTP